MTYVPRDYDAKGEAVASGPAVPDGYRLGDGWRVVGEAKTCERDLHRSGFEWRAPTGSFWRLCPAHAVEMGALVPVEAPAEPPVAPPGFRVVGRSGPDVPVHPGAKWLNCARNVHGEPFKPAHRPAIYTDVNWREWRAGCFDILEPIPAAPVEEPAVPPVCSWTCGTEACQPNPSPRGCFHGHGKTWCSAECRDAGRSLRYPAATEKRDPTPREVPSGPVPSGESALCRHGPSGTCERCDPAVEQAAAPAKVPLSERLCRIADFLGLNRARFDELSACADDAAALESQLSAALERATTAERELGEQRAKRREMTNTASDAMDEASALRAEVAALRAKLEESDRSRRCLVELAQDRWTEILKLRKDVAAARIQGWNDGAKVTRETDVRVLGACASAPCCHNECFYSRRFRAAIESIPLPQPSEVPTETKGGE